MSRSLVVNISDMKLSKRSTDVLVTYSLGSCLGVAAFDPQTRIGGLIHCLLPLSKVAPAKAKDNPFMFVNTGVASMLRTLISRGAKRNQLIIKAAGGAHMMQVNNLFDTGSRNLAALKGLLQKNGLKLHGSDTGGNIPRTMYLYLDTGKVEVKSFGKVKEL